MSPKRTPPVTLLFVGYSHGTNKKNAEGRFRDQRPMWSHGKHFKLDPTGKIDEITKAKEYKVYYVETNPALSKKGGK
jgi:hypothetical protein